MADEPPRYHHLRLTALKRRGIYLNVIGVNDFRQIPSSLKVAWICVRLTPDQLEKGLEDKVLRTKVYAEWPHHPWEKSNDEYGVEKGMSIEKFLSDVTDAILPEFENGRTVL